MKVVDVYFLNECKNLKIKIGGKWETPFICLYRSAHQFSGIFETFPDNFQLTLDALTDKNPFLIPFLDNFNTKATTWYNYDTTSHELCKIEAITSHFGIQQIIKEPFHSYGTLI